MAIVRSSEFGRYDHTFVDTHADHLICNICHLPSQDPYLTLTCCLQDCSNTSAAGIKHCSVCHQDEVAAYINKQLYELHWMTVSGVVALVVLPMSEML